MLHVVLYKFLFPPNIFSFYLQSANIYLRILIRSSCADPESFVRGGPFLITIFLVDEEKEDQNTAINGPSCTCSYLEGASFNWDFGKLPFPSHLEKNIINIGK